MTGLTIQRDARVLDADGEFGRVKHLIVDHETREVTDLVVGRGEHEYVVPAERVLRAEGNVVTLAGRGVDFGALTPYEPDAYHPADESHVSDESARQAAHGGAPLPHADGDKVEVQPRGATEGASPLTGGGDERVPMPAGATEGEAPYRLQLKAEHLQVHPQAEEIGRVSIGKRVVEHTETINVPLREEHVVIERRTVPGTAPAGVQVGAESQVIDIPVMRDRVEVTKEAVVREEVTVRKAIVERAEQVQETVREEQLEVLDGQQFVSEPRTQGPDAPDDLAPHPAVPSAGA